jgi:hypothetical protein
MSEPVPTSRERDRVDLSLVVNGSRPRTKTAKVTAGEDAAVKARKGTVKTSKSQKSTSNGTQISVSAKASASTKKRPIIADSDLSEDEEVADDPDSSDCDEENTNEVRK